MFKDKLLRVYTWTLNAPEITNKYQKLARDVEWNAIKPFIKSGKFLDVGAGAGYSMFKAKNELNCEVFGVDPDPKGHGVGRAGSNYRININIDQGYAESLPYDNDSFDTIYSSHVLEHVNNLDKSIQEMKRVCKNNGVIIIGVPTATMAIVSWFTQFIFTTHIKLVNVLLKPFVNIAETKWWQVFVPISHSNPNRWIIDDIKNYRCNQWEKVLKKHLKIEKVILPFLYPYPEYKQWFKGKRHKKLSSSVFFICKAN